jgi:predicted ATPase
MAMAQALLGAAIPAEVEHLIVTKTDGNPLFIEELTRSLLESGALVQTPEGYMLTQPVEALEVPTTVQGVLLARIDRLHEDLKEVLQVAAVIGRVFSYPLLAQVVQRGSELEQTLGELADLEFIYPTSLAPQREYSFKHVLTQEAVYGTLLRPQREVYHEWIGGPWKPSTQIASKNTTKCSPTTTCAVATRTRRWSTSTWRTGRRPEPAQWRRPSAILTRP